MTTPCPHCQKEIKNSYIGTRLNLNHFKCPYCKGFLKLKNATWENVKSFTVGLLIGITWLVFIESQILPKPSGPNGAITAIALLILGVAGLGAYILFWVRRKLTLIPLKNTGYTNHLKSTFVFLIILPTLLLSILTGLTIYFQQELNNRGIVTEERELKTHVEEFLTKLESNSLTESEKDKALKAYAKASLASDNFKHAYYKTIQTITLFITIALIVLIIGIIMSLFWIEKVGKLEKTLEDLTIG